MIVYSIPCCDCGTKVKRLNNRTAGVRCDACRKRWARERYKVVTACSMCGKPVEYVRDRPGQAARCRCKPCLLKYRAEVERQRMLELGAKARERSEYRGPPPSGWAISWSGLSWRQGEALKGAMLRPYDDAIEEGATNDSCGG